MWDVVDGEENKRGKQTSDGKERTREFVSLFEKSDVAKELPL